MGLSAGTVISDFLQDDGWLVFLELNIGVLSTGYRMAIIQQDIGMRSLGYWHAFIRILHLTQLDKGLHSIHRIGLISFNWIKDFIAFTGLG